MEQGAFTLLHATEFRARRGRLNTAHGSIETPTFMPVATFGAIRLLDSEDMRRIGTQIILGNTLHLESTVGATRIKHLGGLSKFMGWNGPTLTDSGGYQVSYMWKSGTHSLEHGNRAHTIASPIKKIDNKGVTVKNIWTGQSVKITPETAMEWQADIGADIVMAFDKPTFDTDSFDKARESVLCSHDWTLSSYAHWLKLKDEGLAPTYQMFFPIIQGGRYRELRRESAEKMCSLNTMGIAIAGESIGIDPDISAETINYVTDIIPSDKPLYGMGLGGGPEGFLKAVRAGLDMFDNTSPTRLGRCGYAFISPDSGGCSTNKFRESIKKGHNKDSNAPVDSSCDCCVCKNYTRGYLKHLFSIGETTGARLLTYHNLYFMETLGASVRHAIETSGFETLYKTWLN
jgi:queuine tRNA-ribosyltransferase